MADQLMKDLKGMGVITVDFHYVLNVRPSNTSTLYGMETAGLGDVPEKALKGRALSHQATQVIPACVQHVTYIIPVSALLYLPKPSVLPAAIILTLEKSRSHLSASSTGPEVCGRVTST